MCVHPKNKTKILAKRKENRKGKERKKEENEGMQNTDYVVAYVSYMFKTIQGGRGYTCGTAFHQVSC